MVHFESAGISDIGRRRANNEDRISLNDSNGLYLVADGMGGHRAGEVASSLVVNAISEFLNDPDRLPAADGPRNSLSLEAERLLNGIQWSNRVVYEAAQANEEYRGMGSTVAAVKFTPNTLIAANVGDSSIYLIRNGKIDLLSVPHTLRHESAGSAADGPPSHVLTRAVGPLAMVEADLCELSCFRNDVLVLCSDGLSTKVAPWEILSLAKSRAPEAACRSLVELANERGGDDNVSTVVVRVTRVSGSPLSQAVRWLARLLGRKPGAPNRESLKH